MVVNRLVDIVRRVDKVGDQDVDIVRLKYASAAEIVRLISALTKDDGKTSMSSLLAPKVVADDRTNSVVVSGDPKARQRVMQMIRQLDKDQQNDGNTKVYYLKYAKAKNLVEVLTGVSKSIQDKKQGGGQQAAAATKKMSIEADEQTNALVITAQPDEMQELEKVISRLDIRRAQVLVEAIIVEVANGTGAQLGVQWGNTNAGMVQFADSATSPIPVSTFVDAIGSDPSATSQKALASVSGAALGFYHGDWFALLTALQTDSKSDVLATPSLSTMDNQEAEFNVGQEVPVKTGSQSSTDASTVYNTIERKTVGTKLKFKPQINEGDSVLLEIEQEVSSVDSASANSDLGSTFNVRTIKNTVLVKSGETVVLGGLLDEKTNEVVSKVPLLGDIPVLGELFKSTSTDKTKRNLMVFIRPVILRDPVTYSGISNAKYSMFRAEQLDRASKGLRLMPDELTTPVMPAYGSGAAVSPELQKEIEQYRAKQAEAAAAGRATTQGQ